MSYSRPLVQQNFADWRGSFVSSKELLGFPDRLRAQILDDFRVPPFLLDRLCLGSNGFCGSGPVLGSDGRLEIYSKRHGIAHFQC